MSVQGGEPLKALGQTGVLQRREGSRRVPGWRDAGSRKALIRSLSLWTCLSFGLGRASFERGWKLELFC